MLRKMKRAMGRVAVLAGVLTSASAMAQTNVQGAVDAVSANWGSVLAVWLPIITIVVGVSYIRLLKRHG